MPLSRRVRRTPKRIQSRENITETTASTSSCPAFVGILLGTGEGLACKAVPTVGRNYTKARDFSRRASD